MKEPRDKDSIDEFFQDKLGTGVKTPPAAVWDRIEGELNREKRRKFLFWWAPGMAVAIGTLFIAGWLFLRRDHPISQGLRSPDKEAPAEISKAYPASGNTRPGSLQVPGGSMAPQDRPPKDSPFQSARVTTFVPMDRNGDYQPLLPAIDPIIGMDRPDIQIGRIRSDRTLRPLSGTTAIRLSTPQPRFDITAYASQELAGYSLADHDSTGPHGREIEKRQGTSFSRSAGLLVSYRIWRHWVIESGLGFSRSTAIGNPGKAVAVKDNNGVISYQINTVTGYGYLASPGTNLGDSATTGQVTGKLDYISIPLTLSRAWTTGRFTFLAGAGFNVNFLTRATVQASLDAPNGVARAKEVTQYGLRKNNYGFQVKGEFRYQLSRYYAATLLTSFKNSVGPINIHTSYSTYPYNLGLGVAITRSF